MGEVAEMMLDGILCECCGSYIGDACGYPRWCDDCLPEKKTKPKKKRKRSKS